MEKIVARQVTNGVVHYQLRFKGYTSAYDLWHPESALENCKDLIKEYLDANKDPVTVARNATKRVNKSKKTTGAPPVKKRERRQVEMS